MKLHRIPEPNLPEGALGVIVEHIPGADAQVIWERNWRDTMPDQYAAASAMRGDIRLCNASLAYACKLNRDRGISKTGAFREPTL